MSFLTNTKRGSSPPIPKAIDGDDTLTLAQKKRIAIWSTMGLAPDQMRPNLSPPRYRPSDAPPAALKRQGAGAPDRRTMMLEKEKRIREQQEKEEQEELEEQKKRLAKRRGGLQSLGAVMPRAEATGLIINGGVARGGLSGASASREALGPEACSCGIRYLPNAKFCSECGAKRVAGVVPEEDKVAAQLRKEEEQRQEIIDREMRLREEKIKQWQQEPAVEPKKKKAKKKRRRNRDDGDEDDDLGESCGSEEEEEPSKEEKTLLQQPRDGGAYRSMVVPSVKGMVSNDYKGFTDADLERRFAAQQTASAGSLMSEKEAMAMIRREKSDKGKISGAKRVQRELAEWNEKKTRARMNRSKSREHLVVGRK